MLKALLALMFVTSVFAQEVPVTGRSINQVYIGGLEYWPWNDEIPGSPYPDRVLWSFEEGSPIAQNCMLKTNKRLVSWLKNKEDPFTKALIELKRLGGTAQFFVWMNDYTLAPALAARGMREARVWHWCPDGRTAKLCGWQKFESNLTPDGECVMPSKSQAISAIENEVAELSRR